MYNGKISSLGMEFLKLQGKGAIAGLRMRRMGTLQQSAQFGFAYCALGPAALTSQPPENSAPLRFCARL